VRITDEVRVPSPKKRTPFISAPSVTPVAGEDQLFAGGKIFGFVDAVLVFDAHAGEAFVLVRLYDQAAEHVSV